MAKIYLSIAKYYTHRLQVYYYSSHVTFIDKPSITYTDAQYWVYLPVYNHLIELLGEESLPRLVK